MPLFPTTRVLLLAFLITLVSAPATAGEFSAVFNGKSFHIGADQDWNEDNYGLGLEYEFSSTSRWKKKLIANGFRDSNDKMSYMAGGGLHRNLFATDRLRGFYVDAGINAFLMTRQDVNDNAPFPGVLPSLTVGNRHLGLNLTYLPKVAVERLLDESMSDDGMDGILFLQLTIKIDPTD